MKSAESFAWRQYLLQAAALYELRRINHRLADLEHVFNVLGTMESCPTYFCHSLYHSG